MAPKLRRSEGESRGDREANIVRAGTPYLVASEGLHLTVARPKPRQAAALEFAIRAALLRSWCSHMQGGDSQLTLALSQPSLATNTCPSETSDSRTPSTTGQRDHLLHLPAAQEAIRCCQTAHRTPHPPPRSRRSLQPTPSELWKRGAALKGQGTHDADTRIRCEEW